MAMQPSAISRIGKRQKITTLLDLIQKQII